MVDFRRGILAGVAAAAILLIVSVVLEVTGLADRAWMFVESARIRIWLYSTEPLHVIVAILPLLVQGVLFGAIFAALYVHLPRRTAVRQAMAVSLMIWAIGRMQYMYTSLRLPWQANGIFPEPASYGTAVNIHVLGGMLISIASAVAFGALAGAIWNRLKAREVTEPRPGNAALLVGFAIGILMWLGPLLTVVSAAVTGVWSWELMPDVPAWVWGGILYNSAAIVGLVGWILALLGWRRTRKGETGFRRGLAGGILMAVTGVMLLPGVVSIIGAGLSRRELLVEPVSGSESVVQ